MQKYIDKRYDLKRNEVTNKILFKEKNETVFRALNEIEFNTLLIKIQSKGIKVNPSNLEAFLYSHFVESFDPFKEYFEGLPKWDNKIDYIAELAATINTTNNKYFQWILEKWIVALVACSYSEENTNQQVLIFIGEQGCGKTSWVRKLIPKDLKEYLFEGTIIPNDKDTKFHLADKLIINMDELVSFGKSKNDFYKGLITLDYIEQRRPYSRQSSRLMRRASFVAGTNNLEILSDMTGNRRYLCVQTLKIDKDHSVNINKVFAQAVHLFKNGFKFYFDEDDIKRVEIENKHYLQTPEEYDLMEQLFETPNDNHNSVLMSASEVLDYIKEYKRPHKFISVEQIGKALVSLGYKKATRQKKYRIKIKKIQLTIAS